MLPNSVVCLSGELAAGKTSLIKGIAVGVCGVKPEEVSSPTFVYLTIYEAPCPVYHFDLYRLHHAEEFLSMGFEEYFSQRGVCCIEWAERITELLPYNALFIHLEHAGENRRCLTIKSHEKKYLF